LDYLEVWDSLKTAISAAHNVSDLIQIKNKADAYRYAAKIAGESKDVVRKAEEIKLRAERRAGELLKEMPKQKPGASQQRYTTDTFVPDSYRDLKISKLDASKWQRIASIPRKEFEVWIATAPDITTAGALSVSKQSELKREERNLKAQSLTLHRGRYRILYADPPCNTKTARPRKRDGEVRQTITRPSRRRTSVSSASTSARAGKGSGI
jgi:hypothetical protein